jgi:acyl-coenzyme A thioesterase PaaI-like protein
MTSSLAARVHPHCVVCGATNRQGLHVQFRPSPDGRAVEATVDCDAAFQGYEGRLHGGIVSSLLDGAMVHCLFERGRTAYTAELRVRFRGAAMTDRPVALRAWLSKSRGRLHHLEAALVQDGEVKAEAQAKFLEAPWS